MQVACVLGSAGRGPFFSLGKTLVRSKQLFASGLALWPHSPRFLSSVIPQADSQVVKKLGQRLLPWLDRVSPEHLNPSLYLGLRLSSLQAGAKEDLYLHGLKLDYQQCLLRCCCPLSSSPETRDTGVLGVPLPALLTGPFSTCRRKGLVGLDQRC